MLNHLSVERVRAIADLAARAADAHRTVIGGLHDIDLGDQRAERGSRNPTDLDTLTLLDQTANHATLDALRAAIADLDEEARQELKATMLIGRGDFAAGEWDQAMDQAAQVPAGTDVEYVAEKLNLHDYLTKALFAMKCL